MKRQWLGRLRLLLVILWSALSAASCGAQNKTDKMGQTSASNATEDARYAQLNAKLDTVLAALGDTQRELAESRTQMQALKARIDAIDAAASSSQENALSTPGPVAAANMQESVRRLQESTQVLQAEVKQHDQTKVESFSKYPVKISGMLLSSTNLTGGGVDNVDLPIVALKPNEEVANGGLATTWRQSILGLDARGPSFWGGHSAADVRVDFFGGQPTGGYGTNGGTLRLRTAHVDLDWPDSSLTASLDTPLISPLEPTSYLSVAEPAMAWSGNLWSWSPQLAFKHSISVSDTGRVGVEAGLIDPAATASYYNQQLRQYNASESSKQPGYESRVSYTLGTGDHPLTVGVGGYYGRQKYPDERHIDAWAGSADWKLPLGARYEVSGELYRGRALGGLGGGAFKDYVSYGEYGVRGLNDEGGWVQFKARFSPTVESNAAIGQDSAFAREVRNAAMPSTPTTYSGLVANRTVFGNVIYRPRTYLLFSLEYRRIESWQALPPASSSQTLGLAIGYLY